MISFHPQGIDCVFSSLRISIASCLFLDQRDFLDVSLKIVLRILCIVAFSRGRQTNSNTGPLYLLIKSVDERNRCIHHAVILVDKKRNGEYGGREWFRERLEARRTDTISDKFSDGMILK